MPDTNPQDPQSPSKREAQAAYKRQWYLAHREELAEQQRARRLADPEAKRLYNQNYYLAHREERTEKDKAYRDEHREERAAQQREWRLENAEAISQKRKARYEANREAYRIKRKAKYEANREQILARNKIYQESHPEVAKKARQAYKERNRESERTKGRIYQKQRRDADPEGERAKQNAYNAAHREQVNAIARNSRARHRDERNEKQQQRRSQNPEYDAQWRKAHPEVSRLKEERRRARKRNLPDVFTHKERNFMLDYWHHACAACGNQDGFFWTLADDHWIPVTSDDCPGTTAENMIPLCHGKGGCNNTKSDKLANVWLAERFKSTQAKRILKAIEAYFAIVRARKAQDATD